MCSSDLVEKDLMKVLPEDHWILYNIQAIAFGREICTSQRPKCAECPLSNICATGGRVPCRGQ